VEGSVVDPRSTRSVVHEGREELRARDAIEVVLRCCGMFVDIGAGLRGFQEHEFAGSEVRQGGAGAAGWQLVAVPA
jgi:hypothetical protein